MIRRRFRKGYALLLTVLVVGVVASASAITVLLLGLAVERNAFSLQISTQAFANAWSCAEHALYQLRQDNAYTGDEVLGLSYAYLDSDDQIAYSTTNCTVYEVQGTGNENRTICTEGSFGNFTVRRLEITVSSVLPKTLIQSWEEVGTITQCPTS